MINLDFETYSEAGFHYDPATAKWEAIKYSAKNSEGLGTVDVSVYSEHNSTKILCYAYDLHVGDGVRVVGTPSQLPSDFKVALESGASISAWNSFFEYMIWNNVATRTLGWPPLDVSRFECTMQRAAAWGLPGALKTSGSVLSIVNAKLSAEGAKCKPLWLPHTRALKLEKRRELEILQLEYVRYDVLAEQEIGRLVPELSNSEKEVLKLSDKINARGVFIDSELLDKMLALMENMQVYYCAKAREITEIPDFDLGKPNHIKKWSKSLGFEIKTLNKTEDFDFSAAPEKVKQVLFIRRALSCIAFNKIKKLKCSLSEDGRLRGQYMYSGARKTQRFKGRGVQIQNLPRSSDSFCNIKFTLSERVKILNSKDFTFIRQSMESLCDKNMEACGVSGLISTTVRALFCADTKKDTVLVGSDFNSIEARVLAELAGEGWKQKEARGNGKLYEMTAVKMLGSSLKEMLGFKRSTGEHHKDRATCKFADLACGYHGGKGAWERIEGTGLRTEQELENLISLWRKINPSICKFWYDLDEATFSALRNPGRVYTVGQYLHFFKGKIFKGKDALFCRLPSGRFILWHNPTIKFKTKYYGVTYAELLKTRKKAHVKKMLSANGVGLTNEDTFKQWLLFRQEYPEFKALPNLESMQRDTLLFDGVSSQNGSGVWGEREAWNGTLTENIVQAVARDIMCDAMVRVENAGYPIVIHTHDELVCEIPQGFGSVEEFEVSMSITPDWCIGWSIPAAGGWMSNKYEK